MATRVLGPLMFAASADSSNAWSTSTLQCTDSACEQGCVEIRSEQGDDQCHQSSASEFWKGSCNSHAVIQESGCKSDCINCARTFTLPVGKCNSIGGGKYTTTKCSQNSADNSASASLHALETPILTGDWYVPKWQCTDSKCTQGCVQGDVERGSDTCEKLDADQSKRFDVELASSKGWCNNTDVIMEWWDTADCTVDETRPSVGGGGGRSIGLCLERFDYEKLEYDGTYYIEKCSHVSHDIEVETTTKGSISV